MVPKYYRSLFLLLYSLCFLSTMPQAHLIIFSYNRPLQLYALLESVQVFVKGLSAITVIYRTSDNDYECGYNQVRDTFKEIEFLPQKNPPYDFKTLVMHVLRITKQPYLLFAVDDMVVTNVIDISYAADLLEKTQAYGFYFRLGTHLTFCHSAQKYQSVPSYEIIDSLVCKWRFCDGEWDWAYPNTVDMTLYRTKDVIDGIQHLTFKAPNSFEGAWALHAQSIMKRFGLCFQHSHVVNIPLNKVQLEGNTPHMKEFTSESLLNLFLKGKKIDIKPLQNINNIAAHMEYTPLFVDR